MSQIISVLVAVFAFAVVVGATLYGLNRLLGEWSTLLWAALGLCLFFGLCRKINS